MGTGALAHGLRFSGQWVGVFRPMCGARLPMCFLQSDVRSSTHLMPLRMSSMNLLCTTKIGMTRSGIGFARTTRTA